MTEKVHALPGVTLPDSPVKPDPEVVQVCEDMLQLAREGKIQSIAHAYVTNADVIVTGWRLRAEDRYSDLSLSAAIHRLAWRWEAAAEDGHEVDMPSKRE